MSILRRQPGHNLGGIDRQSKDAGWCLSEVPTQRNSYWNKFAVDKLWSFNLGQWRKATVEMLNSGEFQCLITCLRETRAGWNCGRSRKDSFYFCLTVQEIDNTLGHLSAICSAALWLNNLFLSLALYIQGVYHHPHHHLSSRDRVEHMSRNVDQHRRKQWVFAVFASVLNHKNAQITEMTTKKH